MVWRLPIYPIAWRAGASFLTPCATDDAGTSRAERREIQQFLVKRGYDIGAVDGLIGDKSRQAIRQEQSRLGFESNRSRWTTEFYVHLDKSKPSKWCNKNLLKQIKGRYEQTFLI